jgi:superfamily II RNA helicase
LDWKHVVLSTPTGSGKSLVAKALHFQAMAEQRVSFYTAPTKALVNEKFFDLCDAFGPQNVGLLTGDAAVNREAPIVCCTAEVLANMALRDDDLPIDYVVMDEFHFYGDRDRGSAWQIPLIAMHNTAFLLMSATLGDTADVERQLSEFSDREVAVVRGAVRPVPLEFAYRETVLHETIEELVRSGEAPVYLVNFTQRACAEQAQNLMSINVTAKDEKRAIAAELDEVAFTTPYGKEFQRFVRHGIGVHHAGLLPRYRRVVERLALKGLVKVISGTDTLGVGVNIPIRTVVLSRLFKFDGEKVVILSAREFHQIAGRAGRKGFDDHGTVVVQAPEWTIENKKIDAKVAANPHLKKKLVKKRPPPGAVPWDEKTFARLKRSLPEALEPRFEVSHGMLINLLGDAGDRPGGGYRRLIELIRRSHGTDAVKRRRRARAVELFRSLSRAGIVELVPRGEGRGSRVQVRDDLQSDFSLNHTLSLYLVEALEMIDPDPETFAIDALTLVEAILENPRAVLYRQVDKLKGELVGRLKAEGVPYEERMEQLAEVEHPQPNVELIRLSFDAFAEFHPWVDGEGIHPKSIAREMFERCVDFNDYVNEYGLARSEGVLLRYLIQAYKTALQNVPERYWDETFEDILAFLHGVVRRTDSSLLEEWETLMAGPLERTGARTPERPARPPSVADDPRAFKARVRGELHVLLGALARRDYGAACALVHRTDENEWSAERFEQALVPYFEEHATIDVTPRARLVHNTTIREEGPRAWIVQQKIIDPEGAEDWGLECLIDLTEPRDETGPLIELRRVGI